jgi:hypothetical protein
MIYEVKRYFGIDKKQRLYCALFVGTLRATRTFDYRIAILRVKCPASSTLYCGHL